EPGFVSYPHLHVNGALTVSRRMHLPTGPVGLNEVLAFLISEYDVTPLRADWQDILAPRRSPLGRAPRGAILAARRLPSPEALTPCAEPEASLRAPSVTLAATSASTRAASTRPRRRTRCSASSTATLMDISARWGRCTPGA